MSHACCSYLEKQFHAIKHKNVRAFECRIKHHNRHPELIQYGTNLREKEEGREGRDRHPELIQYGTNLREKEEGREGRGSGEHGLVVCL
jgi:hypothetical protein